MDFTTCTRCTGQVAADSTHCPECGAVQAGRSATLHRQHPDKVLAGVCAGLARQFGIDTVILRLFFAIAGLVSLGTVFWAYIVLWVLMPDVPGGRSPASKLMRSLRSMFTSDGVPTRDNAAW